MKKIIGLLLMMCLILTGCNDGGTYVNNGQQNQEKNAVIKKDFKFLSLEWGDSWEVVQNSDAFKDVKTEVARDDGNMLGITAKEVDFYGKKVDVFLMFGKENKDDKGLHTVNVAFNEEDKSDIIAMMTEVYGERQDYFLDDKGIENPITPPGWYCEERVGTSLTDAEKDVYVSKITSQEPSFIDAMLRQPLVIIRVIDGANVIEFKGADAAVVRNIKSE